MENAQPWPLLVVGGGFTGLSIGYEAAKKNIPCLILEADQQVGGLASSFSVNGEELDRFYHHWFTNDQHVMSLIDELDLRKNVQINPTNTGMYYANNFFKLSSPIDVLKFSPLPFWDRIRLGLMVLKARRVKNWKELENKTASQWLQEIAGKKVFEVVWQPLLEGKFGPYANDISAVWFWNKLKLRGGSRGKGGQEQLAYYTGGFISLAKEIKKYITHRGSQIKLSQKVQSIEKQDGLWKVTTETDIFYAKNVVSTTALPLTANFIQSWAQPDYVQSLERIKYLANVCLVLELSKSLSETYWLNVNDPNFPFVGVIEHTNFAKTEDYGGSHIVYLSKYLDVANPLYNMDCDEFLNYSMPYMKEMFPHFDTSIIRKAHLWKARWSQPVVEKNYSAMIPPYQSPEKGFYICSMAQVYPEDRGTNYAIREGRKLGQKIVAQMQ